MKKTVTNTRDEITVNIEVDEINSFEVLNKLADSYVEISYEINENLITYSADVEYGTLFYGINVITPSGKINEEEIFIKFASDPTLASKAVNFIYNVINWSKTNDSRLWQDDENPLGESGAYALCIQDKKYIPLYTELLLQIDMDHEVHQEEHIENIIQKYGLTTDVLRLMAHRTGGACGQHGYAQVEQYRPQLLELFENEPDKETLFLNEAVKSVDELWYCGQLWLENICDLAIYIQDDDERTEWLQAKKQKAIDIFGNNIDMSDY